MVVETETLQRVSLTSGSILVEMGFILHKSNVILWQVVNSVLFILLKEQNQTDFLKRYLLGETFPQKRKGNKLG